MKKAGAEKSVRNTLNQIKDLYAAGKLNSDLTSSGIKEPAELEKVSQVVNEVMTRVTAVEGDRNHLQEWRAETQSRPI